MSGKVTRVIHIRAPLQVRNMLPGKLTRSVAVLDGENTLITKKERRFGWKAATPIFVPERASQYGGATVLLTGDRDSGMVELQVSFCRPDEVYNRKLGRQQAALKDKDVVKVTDIPRELLDIEHQMLCQYSKYLAHHAKERAELTRGGGYAYAMYLFLPKTQQQGEV
jgi:hypothetical protein